MAPPNPSLAKNRNALLDELRVLGGEVLDTGLSSGEQADGLRFLLRMVGLYEEQCLEFADTAHPEFWFVESPTRKIFADCPDTKYRQVQVDPSRQALELRVDPPTARYWSVHLNNGWLESPEYRDADRRVCINGSQAEREADGDYRFWVSASDPGHPNWLDTAGRGEGVLLARYLLPDGGLRPIETRVVDL